MVYAAHQTDRTHAEVSLGGSGAAPAAPLVDVGEYVPGTSSRLASGDDEITRTPRA